jgi:hypothetical protein
MRFFFDRCMSPRLAKMVNAYEIDHTAQHHNFDSRFHEMTTDVEWLTAIGADEPPWVILSGDGRILKNRAERQVLREVNLTFFCMSRQWMHMRIEEIAWKFIKVWPDIVRTAKVSVTTPKIFEISGGHGLKIEEKGMTAGPG